MKYKPVIGLEIHSQLKTQTKMFCDSLNDPDEKHPNTNVCPVCMGHPGTLPVMNGDAVKKVMMTGLALNCKIEKNTFFERKNYFYPDLPKGYQISQYQKPFCYEGHLEVGGKKFRITRIHLEEDAGRLYHLPGEDYSLVDYNRAGVPLMELVTEPDFETGKEVKAFAEELQLILRYLGVSDADMEKGLMRVEVNISLTNPDGSWGTKVEIKNLNSIKAAADSVDYEIKRQGELLENREEVRQETRGWDDTKRVTVSQRSKEEAHDYRYFPEPDLPPLKFVDSEIEGLKDLLSELPQQRRERFKKFYNIPDHDIQVLTVNKQLGDYYEHVATELDSTAKDYHKKKGLEGNEPAEPRIGQRLHSLAANYIITEFPNLMNAVGSEVNDLEGLKITPEDFAELMVLVFHKELSSTGAKAVLKEMAETGLDPEHIIKDKDLGQVSDSGALEEIVAKVIADNARAVEDLKKGKGASLKFLIGMVMRESKGKANPQMVEEIIKEKVNK